MPSLRDSRGFCVKLGAVANRTYRTWGVKIGRKNRKLNSPEL